VIDLHCHVLAGIDDGPDRLEGSVELAAAAAAAGTRTIVATPHVSWSHRNDAATIARALEETRRACADEGLPVEIVPGAEIAATLVPDLQAEELVALSLGKGPWLLIEPPFTSVAIGLEDLVLDLQERGHRIVLAHPERCVAFHRDPRALELLVGVGVLTSVTAGSLVGRFGRRVERFAREMLESDLVHNVASDAHAGAGTRGPGIAAELERTGLGVLSDWLTLEVPTAIIEGGETIPPRPAVVLRAPKGLRRRWGWIRSPLRRAS
jgi:protein-tyrosine phosphatase